MINDARVSGLFERIRRFLGVVLPNTGVGRMVDLLLGEGTQRSGLLSLLGLATTRLMCRAFQIGHMGLSLRFNIHFIYTY